MRIKILNFLLIFIFCLLLLRIFSFQVAQSSRLRELSDQNSIRLIEQEGGRGVIYDRNSQVIAGNSLSHDLMILPQDKQQVARALPVVARVSGISLEELKSRFKKGYTASFAPVVLLKNISLKKAIAFGELKTEYSCLVIQPHPLRSYPAGKLACHVIGYLGEIDHWRLTKLKDYGYKTRDIVGFGGIEEKLDYYLRQKEGALSLEVDHKGKFIRLLGFKPPQDGKDIQLTLDIRIQKLAEEALGERKGAVVLMDPYSGEVLVMASSPGFEPEAFLGPSVKATQSFSNSALVNRAISSSYAPGSVFKLVTAAGGVETKKINLSTTYFCPGKLRVGNRDFACWDTHNQENLAAAIAHSCDVFFYKTGLLIGPQALHDYAVKFGLGKPTGIDLPYEVNGFVPDPLWKKISRLQGWYDGDTANFSIGQGDLLTTPLQISRLVAVFANQGTLVTPYLIKSVGGVNFEDPRRRQSRVPVKKEIIGYLRKDMIGTIKDPSGTANILAVLPVEIAGKTGTAQAGPNRTHGWFAGFFPYAEPRYVICVFLEGSGSGHMASILAKQIIQGMIDQKIL